MSQPNQDREQRRRWSLILAGGEGERVRPLVQRWLGHHKPKQYCTFVGNRSMFQHTVDRAASLTPPQRMVAVIARGHRRDALAQLEGRHVGTVLEQPDNRDTAAGLFLPLAYIRASDPLATVVVFPSDHFIYPEEAFLRSVDAAARAAERLQDRVVLLGVPPDRLELEYGWILPSRFLARSEGRDVTGVRAFMEKPTAAQADQALSRGALWNTLVLAGTVSTLWAMGRQCFPEITALFERLAAAIGSAEEERALAEIYREMPARNFSAHLLQAMPERVAVMELTGVLWSDWGKPERIAEMLQRIGRQPAFPLDCLEKPFRPLAAAG